MDPGTALPQQLRRVDVALLARDVQTSLAIAAPASSNSCAASAWPFQQAMNSVLRPPGDLCAFIARASRPAVLAATKGARVHIAAPFWVLLSVCRGISSNS